MSNKNYGCHGYVVKAETLTSLLPLDVQPAFTEALTGDNTDLVRELIENHLPEQYPMPEVFVLNDEGESDDIERGTVYAYWGLEQLFQVIPRTELQLLKTAGIEPAHANWVVWS